MTRRPVRPLVATGVLIAVLAACASGQAGSPPSSGADATAPPSMTAAPKSSAVPATTAPSTTAPSTTEPPTTEPPSTEPPSITEVPVTTGSPVAGRPVEASAGCAATPLTPGREDIFITNGGATRSYSRYVPTGLAPGEPAPLIVDFPAYSPGSLEETFSGFTTPDAAGEVLADRVGAIVVTPEPTNGSGLLLTWNYVGTPGWSDDQAFVTALLDHVGARACIDTARVLATGFAVGAVFASITVCAQPDRFAVLATVAGLHDPAHCVLAEPVPVISFHGTGDRFIPFEGSVGDGPASLGLTPETVEGLLFMVERPGAIAASTAWAERNGCSGGPVETSVADGVTTQVWSDCRDEAGVELYVVDGGEHTWPGSVGMADVADLLGPVDTAVDATELIWAFFATRTT